MTKELCERLGLPQRRNYMQIPSIDSTRTTALIETHHATIWLMIKIKLRFSILPKITFQKLINDIYNQHEPLVDSFFHIPEYIDLLLGSTIFWELLYVDQIKLGRNQSAAQIRMDYPGPLMNQRTCRLPSPVCHPIVATLRISWNVSRRYRKALFVQDELKVMKNAKTSLCGHIVATKTDTLKYDSLYVIA